MARGDLAEIATYADLLPARVGSDLKLMEMDVLVIKLRDAQQVEAIAREIAADREETILQNDEAAGLFRALGASYRIHN
ncbi:MAG: hypothetical protein DMG40_24445 [Acidobacteria bacterium]|nr:MAG: hypothetical protein DMG40_24445 [Acidobacteriota bacterium]